MSELRDAGHARLRTIHESGRFNGRRWEISEERSDLSQDAEATAEQPHFRQAENPVVCDGPESLKNRQTEYPAVKRLKNDNNKITPQSPPEREPADAGPAFEEFERVYPFGDADPCQALRYFRGLTVEERRKVLAHAPGYVADRKARGLQPATPQTYLRSRYWETHSAYRDAGAASSLPHRRDARALAGPSGSSKVSAGVYPKPDGNWFLSSDTRNLSAWREYERRNGIRNPSLTRPAPWPPGYEPAAVDRAA